MKKIVVTLAVAVTLIGGTVLTVNQLLNSSDLNEASDTVTWGSPSKIIFEK